jgi:hypothetical protein
VEAVVLQNVESQISEVMLIVQVVWSKNPLIVSLQWL